MRKCVGAFMQENPEHPIGALGEHLIGNVGFIFVKKDLAKVREIVASNVVGAPARVGQIAENDVVVPAGPTGCDPGQTAVFQSMNVPTSP